MLYKTKLENTNIAIVLVNMCVWRPCVFKGFMRCELSQVRLSVLPWEPVFDYLTSTGGTNLKNHGGSQKLNFTCTDGWRPPFSVTRCSV